MSKTLLEQLKDRKLMAQKKPIIEFNFPDDKKPEMIIEAKRLSAIEVRNAQTAVALSSTTEDTSKFYIALFNKILPHIISIKDAEGKDYDIKETVSLMRNHFGAGEAVTLGLQYQLAAIVDDKEAEEDPNE